MNSDRDNTSKAGMPRASVDAMISEAMDLELAGDDARAADVWRLIDEKYPADRAVVRGLRQGMRDLRGAAPMSDRKHEPANRDFTSAVMVRLASEDDLDALDVTARAELEASAQAVIDDESTPRVHAPAKRANSLQRLTRLRISTTTIAFVLGMCVTTALVVVATKYHKPHERSIAGEMAVQRAMQMPETPAITDAQTQGRQPLLRLGNATRYERARERGESTMATMTIMGGSGAIHARVPIGLAPFSSPVTYASNEGVAMRGATLVFDPLWRMRERGLGTGVLQPPERAGMPIGEMVGELSSSRIQIDGTGMLVLPVR
jgi:hypothetical protein